jgi:hypothetical protein
MTHLRCLFESSKLHREVPDRRALDHSATKRQTGCFRSQTIQKRIPTSATHNVDAFKLLPSEPNQAAQDLSIAMRETMEDKSCKGGKRRSIVLWESRYALLQKLPIDGRGEMSWQQECRIVHIHETARSWQPLCSCDQLGHGPRIARRTDLRLHLLQQPHAVYVLVEIILTACGRRLGKPALRASSDDTG